MAAAEEKKKVTLNFGMSKDKLKALAGNTLKDGGLPMLDPPTDAPGKRGPLSDAFNAAAAATVQPPRPAKRSFSL
jgi:hypothetical protein